MQPLKVKLGHVFIYILVLRMMLFQFWHKGDHFGSKMLRCLYVSVRGVTSLGKILGIRKIQGLNLHLRFGRVSLTFFDQIRATQKLEKVKIVT